MSGNRDLDPQTLDYARPATHKPNFQLDPAAEALIDKDAKPTKLSSLLGHSSRAAVYYGNSMAIRYPWDLALGKCVVCGAEGGRPTCARWSLNFPAAFANLEFTTATIANVVTFHSVCDPCRAHFAENYRRTRIPRIMQMAGGIGLGLVIALSAILLTNDMLDRYWRVLAGSGGGMVILLGVAEGLLRFKKFRFPIRLPMGAAFSKLDT